MGKGVQTAYTEKYMQRYLWQENVAKNRTLRDLAKEFGVSHGVIQRGLDGKFPKRKDLREKMYLAPIEEVEACLSCGQAHVTKRCTQNSKPRPPRIAIRLDNPESAARSIINNMEEDKIKELLDRVLAHRIMTG
jgi:hypothetical protein